MGSLFQKQWRENWGTLLVFSGWMLLGAFYCVGYEVAYQYRAEVGSFCGIAMFYSIGAALYLAMRTSQGEQDDGTLGFTASLPVSLSQVAATRIANAALTLVIPLLIGATFVALALASGLIEQASPRPFPYELRLPDRETAALSTSLEQLASVTAISMLGGTQLLVILSVAGCWLRSQTQVGFLGVLLGLGAMIGQGLFWYSSERMAIVQLVYGALLPQSLVIQWGYGTEIGSYTDHELVPYRWISLGLTIVIQLVIGLLFMLQYGRMRKTVPAKSRGSWRWRLPSVWTYIPIRPIGPGSALAWLELRQAFPLVVYGFLLALVVTGVTVFIEDSDSASAADSFRSQLPHSVFFVGMLWSTVVAAGLFSADLGERLGSFWRSRPISPGMWFWTKYSIGLAMVLLILDGLSILVSWNAPREAPTQGMSWAFVACFPILHAWLYTLAVLGTCWLRKPVLGGFVSIVTYTVLLTIVTSFPATTWMEPITVYNGLLMAEREGNFNLLAHGYPLVFGGLVLCIALIASLASQAAKPLESEGPRLAFGR